MATAIFSTVFELKLVNDAASNFTVGSLGRPYQLFFTEIATTGAANPVIVGKNGVGASEEIFSTNVSGAGFTTAIFAGATSPTIDRGIIGGSDNIQVSPVGSQTVQLTLNCMASDTFLPVS